MRNFQTAEKNVTTHLEGAHTPGIRPYLHHCQNLTSLTILSSPTSNDEIM